MLTFPIDFQTDLTEYSNCQWFAGNKMIKFYKLYIINVVIKILGCPKCTETVPVVTYREPVGDL